MNNAGRQSRFARAMYWRDEHFLGLEATAAFLIAGWFAWSHRADVAWILDDAGRPLVYTAFVALFGTMLGFGVTAISVLFSVVMAPSLRSLRESRHFKYVRGMFSVTNLILGLGTLCSLVGLLFDRRVEVAQGKYEFTDPLGICILLLLALTAASTAAVARVIWLVAKLVRRYNPDEDDDGKPEGEREG